MLRESMSEDLLFAKIAEPDTTAVNFKNHFRDRMGEVDRGHLEEFPKLSNLRQLRHNEWLNKKNSSTDSFIPESEEINWRLGRL